MHDLERLAVHRARLMRVVKPCGCLRENLHCHGRRELRFAPQHGANQCREGDANDKLHHEVERIVLGASEVERLHDMRA